MEKSTINLRSLADKHQANADRMLEIADACEREGRARTEAETAEYETLSRENDIIAMKMRAASAITAADGGGNPLSEANRRLRENLAAGETSRFVFKRDYVTTGTVESGGIIPINVQDILDPLQEGLILDKVGIQIQTGLAGEYIWPAYQPVEATILDEAVELQDSDITLSKLTATPERMGLAIPLTKESINQTQGVIEYIVRKAMPQAITTLVNKILFSTEKVGSANKLVGPFVDCAQTAELSELTFKALNLLKAQVLATGIEGNGLCWVMTKANKAILEATPKDAGSGIMVCENDKICGLPVYTTNFIGENHIGLGDWSYQAMGLFGELSFVVDPYTKARNNTVDFVLNVNYGTVTLRPEAFLLATIAGDTGDSGNAEP